MGTPACLTQATTGLVMRPALSASTRLYSSRPGGATLWTKRPAFEWAKTAAKRSDQPAAGRLQASGASNPSQPRVHGKGRQERPLTSDLSQHNNHFDLRQAGGGLTT